ncbi:S1 RNA-binding domain-containing protein [Gemmiger formicilis]|jgi:polyribonucleotide nucleotidyltransferase|uniref:S1 RNA-binding domain-containing protein n=1 Tax=Gemmiger formicilis TaxID=745368 RepID=UPI003A90112F
MANVVNPYSFVPLGTAPARTSLDACYTGPLLTGRLDYTLTTDTPLLIPDSAKVVKDEKIDHKRYPFFRLPDGTPAIPGSEMRGAMRGVYEAVTNSCLSVLLDSTEEPFSQRLPSTNGFKDHGLLGIDPETGEWVLYAADVVDYLKLSEGRDGSLMRNGWLNWYGREYHNGQHTRLRPDRPSGWLQFNRPITLRNKNYHVRLLAPKPGRPVIFRWQDDTPYRALSNILKKSADNDPRSAAHGDLLAALEKVHNGDPAQGGLVPVWYLLADDNGTPRCYLSGASIGRVMQGRSWAEIMGNYAPCADTDALCPGCALFGTVKGKGTSGRVRFTDAEAAQYESLGNKTLPILSGPKPSAYEFYLEKPKSTYETSIGFWNYDFCSLEETKYFPDGTKRTIKKFRVYTPQPRGRKFYWHSAPRTENERSNQNATLEAMKGTFKGSVYFDRITRAQLEELAFVLTLGENTPASPRLHKIGHGKPVGYGSCKITLTGGELRTLAQQDGTLCYTTEPLPLDSLLAAHGRIDTDSTSVKSLLKIADKRSTQSKTVEYPSAKDKNGNDKIFNWFSQNRKHAKSLITLPHPLDDDIEIKSELGQNRAPAPQREGFAAPPRRENFTPQPRRDHYTPTQDREEVPLYVDKVYTGKVTNIQPYGAFVDLGNHHSGLVYISEIANRHIHSVSDELQIGQTVRVKVLDIKWEGGKEKISLSIKQAEAETE